MNRTLTLVVLLLASTVQAKDPLPAEKELTNALGMKLRRIEPGEFTMGSGKQAPTTKDDWILRDADEAPAHKVKIANAYFLGVHEVTNAQYEQFDPEHKKLRGKFGIAKEDNDPVTFVTWQQAVDFCKWLSKKEGKPYRLPTEAEWEYACRAGTTTLYSTGDTLTPEQANLGLDKDGKTRISAVAVGKYAANPWGLHDMHGNVAEWCLDWYGPYEADAQTDPVGREDGTARVVRGWSWLSTGFQKTDRFTRSSNRSGLLPEDANRYTGFRVVMGEMPATRPLPPAGLLLHQKDVKQKDAPKEGSDPKKPYFVNYKAEKTNPTIPPNTWGPIFSNHNHYSSVCVCPNGDVLAVWYSCSGESDRQLAQAASRLRAGSDKWDEASFFFGTPDVNSHAPVLLRDGKRIYHFCTQSFQGWDYAADMMRYSDDSGATWSKPQIILPRDDPNALSQPCSAFVARDGTIVLACDGNSHKDEKLILSSDKGKTWKVASGDMRKSAGGKYVIHPAIFERKDGSILCYLRGQDPMPLLISKDMGESWQAETSPFGGISGGQKAAVLRLSSGSMIMLTADTKKWFGGGSLIALSTDEGKTWAHARKVDAPVEGYMSLAEAPNGVIYLVGSRMGFAACNETWIKEGKPLPSTK